MEGDMNLPRKKIELIYHEIMGDVIDLTERLESGLELQKNLQAEAVQLLRAFQDAKVDIAKLSDEGVNNFDMAMRRANESCMTSLSEIQLERELSRVKGLNRMQLFIFGMLAGLGLACFALYVATLIVPGK